MVADRPESLTDRIGCCRARLDGYLLRVTKISLCDLLDFFRHGGRKKRHLPLFRNLLKDPFDIINETHPEHLVGFVEDQRLQGIQLERSLAHMIHDSAGCPDDDMNASPQLLDLSPVSLTTINGYHVKTSDV